MLCRIVLLGLNFKKAFLFFLYNNKYSNQFCVFFSSIAFHLSLVTSFLCLLSKLEKYWQSQLLFLESANILKTLLVCVFCVINKQFKL